MEAGATYSVTIPFVDVVGDPIDLTDYCPTTTVGATGGRAMLRRSVDEVDGVGTPAAPILSLTAAAIGVEGIYIVLPPTLGLVTITIYPATLEALSFAGGAPLPLNRTGFYDLEVEGTAVTNVLRLCEGPYQIDPEVTR